jgi:putative ABC transport system permease protein
MPSLLRTLSLRYLRRRWFRALLIAVSIALGVATLVATQALNRSMTRAVGAAANPAPGGGALQVTNGDLGVPRELARQIVEANLPGVRAALPVVIGRVTLPDLDGRSVRLLGADRPEKADLGEAFGLEVAVNPLNFRPGTRAALAGADLAASLPPGTATLRVRGGGREHRLSLVGTVRGRGQAAALGGNVLLLPLDDAGHVLGRPGVVNRVDLVLQPAADVATVRREVEGLLAGRATVRSAGEADTGFQDVIGGVQIGFQLSGAGALVVGLFLVYNVLSVSVAERRHDIGILRSLGATRSQVAGLFAGEAVLLGLAGSVLGLPLGYALARLALAPMGRVLSTVFPLEVQSAEVTPGLALAAVAAGAATALLAALVPAVQAGAEQPADAVRRSPPRRTLASRLAQIAASAAVIALGVGCVAARAHLPPRVGTFVGLVLTLVGTLAAAPLFAALTAWLLGPVLRRLLGLEGRLAADNLARSPGRTGLVVGALAAGVALVLQTAGTTLSTEGTVLTWIEESVTADLFVSADAPVGTGGQNQPLSDELGRRFAEVPGVAAALPVRFRRVDFRNSNVFLVALDPRAFYDANRGRVTEDRKRLFLDMRSPGDVVVSDNFARLYGLGVGDGFSLPTPDGPVSVRVAATVVDYSWNRGTVFLDLEWYRQHFRDDLVDVYDLFLEEGADADAVRDTLLRRWGLEHNLVILTRPMLRDAVTSAIRGLYGLAYAQELVLGLVAALGVVSALLISVLQRRRELGLLRAVGATQGQVLRSVLAESALMGLTGGIVGVLVGVPLEWFTVGVLLPDESGFTFDFRVPWATAVGVAAASVAVALVAGLGPAWHAMRLRIAEAIAYE